MLPYMSFNPVDLAHNYLCYESLHFYDFIDCIKPPMTFPYVVFLTSKIFVSSYKGCMVREFLGYQILEKELVVSKHKS